MTEWPAADLEAWRRALDPGDVLEPGGLASRWRPATVRKHRAGYGRWLHFLASCDQLDIDVFPTDRATPETVAAYARELADVNSPRTVLGRLEELRDVMRVMQPQQDWSWIGRIATRCGRREGDSLKKRARLRPSPELFQLGVRLMAEAERPSGTMLERAVAFRGGLLIAFLAARPLRLGSLLSLRLADVARRGDAMWVMVPEEASKTRTSIEMPLPAALTPAISAYVDLHRRALLRGAFCEAFWVSLARKPLSAEATYQQITRVTRQALGVSINPHAFRRAAATSIAIADPEHVAVAASLLGHKNLRVTQEYYDQSRMVAACRRFQHALVARRRSRRARAASLDIG